MPVVTRNSKQREAILSFLSMRKDHPTAEIVYEHVREVIPNISLGTVYRNLGLLSEQGVILKLSPDGKTDHFDFISEPHYHLACDTCGSVTDIDLDFDASILAKAQAASHSRITSCSIIFHGTCCECCKE